MIGSQQLLEKDNRVGCEVSPEGKEKLTQERFDRRRILYREGEDLGKWSREHGAQRLDGDSSRRSIKRAEGN